MKLMKIACALLFSMLLMTGCAGWDDEMLTSQQTDSDDTSMLG